MKMKQLLIQCLVLETNGGASFEDVLEHEVYPYSLSLFKISNLLWKTQKSPLANMEISNKKIYTHTYIKIKKYMLKSYSDEEPHEYTGKTQKWIPIIMYWITSSQSSLGTRCYIWCNCFIYCWFNTYKIWKSISSVWWIEFFYALNQRRWASQVRCSVWFWVKTQNYHKI